MTVLDDDDIGKELIVFQNVTSVSPSGEMKVNAGKYARAMIVMAYEMMGGAETFAEWAMNNKGDFYTKMFTKIIGRENEDAKGTDPVESYLAVLDLEADDITPDDAPPELVKFTKDNLLSAKLAHAAKVWAESEPVD